MTPFVPLALRDGPTVSLGAPAPLAGGRTSPLATGASLPVARGPVPWRPASGTPVPAAPARRMRGRHVREHRLVRVGLALAAADIAVADDLLVLQVLRLQPLGDLDAAQVSALSALPPSIVAPSLDRLVRSGLAKDRLVDGRVRFGLP